ncbi:MAG: DUF4184 family protein [Nitrososphaerota archaeon]
MPVTILHIVYVWPILRKLKNGRITLFLGSMIPDIEIPILAVLGYSIPRGLAHSIIGAITIDSLLAVLTARLLYSSMNVRKVLGIKNNLREDIGYLWAIASIGALSHVIIDYLHHSYNPLLWPLLPIYFEGPLTITLGYFYASLILHIVSAVILILILVYSTVKIKTSLSRLVLSPRTLYRVMVEPDF